MMLKRSFQILLSLAVLLTISAENPQNITSAEFQTLMQTVADGWSESNARKAADCFTEDAIYTEQPDKQLYKGRKALFKFFGGNEGRKSQMKMTWHHLIFDQQIQIVAGEFTFEYGSKVHGNWEKFIGENKF